MLHATETGRSSEEWRGGRAWFSVLAQVSRMLCAAVMLTAQCSADEVRGARILFSAELEEGTSSVLWVHAENVGDEMLWFDSFFTLPIHIAFRDSDGETIWPRNVQEMFKIVNLSTADIGRSRFFPLRPGFRYSRRIDLHRIRFVHALQYVSDDISEGWMEFGDDQLREVDTIYVLLHMDRFCAPKWRKPLGLEDVDMETLRNRYFPRQRQKDIALTPSRPPKELEEAGEDKKTE